MEGILWGTLKNGFWVVCKWQRKLISCKKKKGKKGNFVKYWRDLNRYIRLLVGFKRAIRVFPSVPVERHFSHSWISHPLFIWTSNESLTNWAVIELSRNFAPIKAVLDPEARLESQSHTHLHLWAKSATGLNVPQVADVVDIYGCYFFFSVFCPERTCIFPSVFMIRPWVLPFCCSVCTVWAC